MSIKIVLADLYPLILEGLRSVLDSQPDFRIIAETGNGLEVVRLVEYLQPDVLVLDWMVPGIGALEIMHLIRQCAPMTRVIILATQAGMLDVAEALRAGAMAFVLKSASSGDIINAICAVLDGRRYLSASLARDLHDFDQALVQNDKSDTVEALTKRERQVMRMIVEGMTNQEVARQLDISRRTVETHRTNLKRKLGVRSTAGLVRYALAYRNPPTA